MVRVEVAGKVELEAEAKNISPVLVFDTKEEERLDSALSANAVVEDADEDVIELLYEEAMSEDAPDGKQAAPPAHPIPGVLYTLV
jgi:hypothetical protein